MQLKTQTNDNIFSGRSSRFASFVAGPRSGGDLSDFGADVIKVEPPGRVMENREKQDSAATAIQVPNVHLNNRTSV